jgi:hypothetical protein
MAARSSQTLLGKAVGKRARSAAVSAWQNPLGLFKVYKLSARGKRMARAGNHLQTTRAQWRHLEGLWEFTIGQRQDCKVNRAVP